MLVQWNRKVEEERVSSLRSCPHTGGLGELSRESKQLILDLLSRGVEASGFEAVHGHAEE